MFTNVVEMFKASTLKQGQTIAILLLHQIVNKAK